MDSSNFQHHQQHLQDHEHHFVPSSPLNTPSIYQPLSSSLPWNHSFFSTNNTGSISNPFNTKLYQDNDIHTVTGDSRSSDNNLSSKTISTITDNDTKNLTFTSTTNFQKIEEDMLSSFPSFSSLIQSTIIPGGPSETLNWFNGGSSSSEGPPGLIQLPSLDQKDHHHQSPLINWSGGFTNPSLLNQLGLVSSPNSTTSVTSSPRLGLNLQAMNFFGNNNANFNCGNNNNSNNHRSFYDNNVGEEVVSQAYGGRVISNKTMMNGGTSAKRATSGDNQPKASTSNNTTSTKKSQLKVSCPPFKVRKEKLGERIAALHQLVSPFGKTDTASVLTEAIGYIQFLQDQIHTLCMPHAKSSRSKACRPFQMGGGIEEERKEEERIDLGRRGLCLVPLSWTSYLTPTQLDASNPSYF